LNYRHQFHAGNFADVFKHVLLVRLVRALQIKPKGVFFLDTHAGRGAYDLSVADKGDSLAREPEHPGGIGRLFGEEPVSAALTDYLSLVRSYDGGHREACDVAAGAAGLTGDEPGGTDPRPLRYYPGSPWLFKLLARPQDRIALCEKHPDEFLGLYSQFVKSRRVSVHEMDGYTSIKAMLPPPERRALVLIDPPYEAQDEASQIVGALGEAIRRFPSGVYAIWHPLTERLGSEAFIQNLEALPLPPSIKLELMVEPAATGLKGCGLFVVNPPWRFDVESAPVLADLAARMGRAPTASSAVHWVRRA
jgi:23S rRNA (adenine2030-N6)-methyltransferase